MNHDEAHQIVRDVIAAVTQSLPGGHPAHLAALDLLQVKGQDTDDYVDRLEITTLQLLLWLRSMIRIHAELTRTTPEAALQEMALMFERVWSTHD